MAYRKMKTISEDTIFMEKNLPGHRCYKTLLFREIDGKEIYILTEKLLEQVALRAAN